ncbi:hypothetical protein H6A18_03235 [Collinsella tanakaei]|uniref:hypothetical protein n=1 Tax=Collinsella tanakaei TaxID=626935 RepID=UPI00195BC777|nr:hypothetical protein [Collinsella tanakaei]MBM6755546.1 hypothetical protein [Collinsella tanakaei]
MQAQTESAYDFFRAQGSDVAAGLLNGTVGPRVMKDGTYLHSYTQLGSATDATSLANMLASLDMLEEMNKVRTQVEHIGELKVTDTAMAYTMLAANWSSCATTPARSPAPPSRAPETSARSTSPT